MPSQLLISYTGKAKDLTLEELFLLLKFGRKVELLEVGDFSFN